MADPVLLSIASKILITIASPAFVKAYKKSSTIMRAGKDLEALERTIHTIQAKLEVAEKTRDEDATMKNWIERIGDVLHEADDLFDEVAANLLLKQQMKGNKLVKEVKVQFSELNPLISNYSIAKKVKNIRQELERIAEDVSLPDPAKHSQSGGGRGTITSTTTTSECTNPRGIVGRDEDQKSIREFLLSNNHVTESSSYLVPVIAVVGIGGIGKTTLAQLICGDKQVQKKFQKRWWVCLSNTAGETEVLKRIFESIQGETYEHQISQLTSQIMNLVQKTKKDPRNYLLILDDVLSENLGMWDSIIPLLSSGAKGSKIIVTTTHPSVAAAMHAVKTYDLGGLSNDSSWELFKRIAIPQGEQSNIQRSDVGREIVAKCTNNPLAIKSIAAILYTKPSIEEWRSVRDDPNLQCQSGNSIISRLRVSLDYLKPELKSCFAYCSLFPKSYEIDREELIHLWIAQGYVSLESVANGYFNEMVRMYFFEELQRDKYGQITTCKMHALFHQLAQEVAGGQSVVLTKQQNNFVRRNRHLAVGYEMDNEWTIPESLLVADRLRSSLFMYRGSLSPRVLDKLFTEFKFLRALNLEDLKLGEVSDSVGDLKHLRYLNLSENTFECLPSSMSKLVNLLTLEISRCVKLKALPDDIRKLISLRVLNANSCHNLTHMPPRLRELASLEYLSYFNARDESRHKSSLVYKLRRKVQKGRDECHQLPPSVRVLEIANPTETMPYWDRSASISALFPNLVKLHVFDSESVTCLPRFSLLPSLTNLRLSNLKQLQYVEANEGSEQSTFFPDLKYLTLEFLPRVKAWFPSSQSAPANNMPHFDSLWSLRIEDCKNLESIPLSPKLQILELRFASETLVAQLLPAAGSHSSSTCTPAPSSLLTTLSISGTNQSGFQFEYLTLLQRLQIENCSNLKSLELGQQNVLEELQVLHCPNLMSYGLNETGVVDWNSLPKLSVLIHNNIKMQREGY